jgi:hypothetical protein
MEYSAVEYDEGINDIQSSIRYKEWQDRLDIANKFTQAKFGWASGLRL